MWGETSSSESRESGVGVVKRSYVLAAVVCATLLVAVGLRIAGTRNAPDIELRPEPVPASVPSLPPVPRDFVAEPIIEPGERDAGPKRIISLAPSITELVCALGLRDRLVGRTPYCHYPPGVEAVPAVGALQDPNFERIRSLSPDMILITANSARLAAGLSELGLQHYPIPHESLADVFAAVEEAGRVCNRPVTARRLADAIRADLASLEDRAARSVHRKQRVLISLGPLPVPPRALWAAGPGSFLDELVSMAGQENAAREALKVSHGEIPLTRLRGLNPDVILEFGPSRSDHDRLEMYRTWSEIGPVRAIEQQRVRVVGKEEWLSAGPRIAITLHCLIASLSEFN